MTPEERAAAILVRFSEELDDGLSPDPERILREHPDLDELLRIPLAQELRLARAAHANRADAPGPRVNPVEAESIGPYRVVRELGVGGQGIVYLAQDTQLPRLVALKLLRAPLAPSEQARARFRREAEIAAKLDHPGICTVFQANIDGDPPYIAMRYVDGQSIAQLIDVARSRASDRRPSNHITLPQDDSDHKPTGMMGIVAMIEKAARALHVAHDAGLVHRDIKPGNIMITPTGDPVILDFGLARDDLAPSMTLTGTSVGTPEYMSPEQIDPRGQPVDRVSDVYALGVTLFECLTLHRPFSAPTREGLYHQILTGDAESARRLNPSVPADLEVVVATALQRDRARRYSTALAFAEDLRRVRVHEPILARPEPGYRRLARSAARHPVFTVLLIVFMVAAPGALQWSRMKDRDAALSQVISDRTAATANLAAYRALQARRERAVETLRNTLTRRAYPVSPERAPAIFSAENEIRSVRFDAARALADAESSVERAGTIESRYGAVSEETNELRVEIAYVRYAAAVADRDTTGAAVHLESLRKWDKSRRRLDSIVGDGHLRVTCTPPDAELYLYRYVGYETVRAPEPVVPRLVPVPWCATGKTRDGPWAPGFGPGDPCLVVRAVAPGSPAASQDVEIGDLLLRIEGAPCGEGLFVSRVVPGGLADRWGVRPWWNVSGIDQVAVRSLFEWTYTSGGSTSVVSIGPRAIPTPVGGRREDALGISVVAAAELLHTSPPSEGATLTVLHLGVVRDVRVRAGEVSGIDAETTAYPLIVSDQNRIDNSTMLRLAPGGYLILVRRGGYETSLLPIEIRPGAESIAPIDLLPVGSTPNGFLWIPPGTSRVGGDPDRDDGINEHRAARDVEVPGFFIQRCEMSTREWFTFVNRPETRELIERARTEGRTIRLPRHYDDPQPFAQRNADGTWFPTKAADGPVLGVTRNDVEAFLDAHNQDARAGGEPWLWDLPTPLQLERAGRGADGRLYPWGDRYDDDLCVNLVNRPAYLYDMPSRFEPRDESPFGVADLAGSRREMCRENEMRGGSWADADARISRLSYSEGYGPGWLNWSEGFRVVLVPNPDASPPAASGRERR